MFGRLLAVAVAVAAFAAAAPAQAQGTWMEPPAAADHRACVSKAEYWSAIGVIVNLGGLTRDRLEAHWEVVSDGRVYVPGLGPADTYRRCGYGSDEAWIAVRYGHSGKVLGIADWLADDATLHGRP